MNILVVGSVALDTVETPVQKVTDVLGGSATYFAAAASYFSPVRVVAAVGEDFPLQELDFLKEKEVDFTGLQIRKGKSFRWAGRYGSHPNDRQTLLLEPGVFSQFQPTIPEQYRDSNLLFLANIDPELQLRVLEQVSSPRLSCCDTIDHWIRTKREVLLRNLAQVGVVILNDSEMQQLTEELSLIKAAKAVLERGAKIVIVKKGEHGAVMFTPDALFSVPAYPVESVSDPTGAGDSFAGGFLGYLAQTGDFNQTNLRRAVVYGSVMASFTVEKFSVDGLKGLTCDQIEERFARFKQITYFE